MENKETKAKRIILYGVFVCYVEDDILKEMYRRRVTMNIADYVRKQANLCYGIELNCKEAVQQLHKKVLSEYYINCGDWLRERMRHSLKVASSNEVSKSYIISRVPKTGMVLYAHLDGLLQAASGVEAYTWITDVNRAQVFESKEKATQVMEEHFSKNLQCIVMEMEEDSGSHEPHEYYD